MKPNVMRKSKMENNSMQMDIHMPADFLSNLTSGDRSSQTLGKVLLALPNFQSLPHTVLDDDMEHTKDVLTQLFLNPVYQLK